MSLIFPKKEILYAPMLGTLGGGSARGFGRGIGGVGGPRLFVHSFQQRNSSYISGEVSIKGFTSSTTANALQKSTTNTVEGNYSSTVADTYVHTDGKILQVTYKDSYIYLWDADNLAGGPISSDFIGSDCRCLLTASDNNIYVFLGSGNNNVYRYSVSNSYALSRDQNFTRPRSNTVEGAVSPPNDPFVYYGDHDGYVYQVNITNGQFNHWSSTGVNITVKSMAFGSNRRVYFGGNAGELGRVDVSTGGVFSNLNTSNSHAWGTGGAIESIVVDKTNRVHWFRRNGGYLDRTNRDCASITNANFGSRTSTPAGVQAIGDYVYVGTNGSIDDSVFRYPIANVTADEGTSGTLLGYCNELTTDVRTDDNTARNLEEAGVSFT